MTIYNPYESWTDLRGPFAPHVNAPSGMDIARTRKYYPIRAAPAGLGQETTSDERMVQLMAKQTTYHLISTIAVTTLATMSIIGAVIAMVKTANGRRR